MRSNPSHHIAAFVLVVFVALICPQTRAQQVYKCVKEGKTTFQANPCDAGSTSTSMRQPRVTGGGLPWEGLRPDMSADYVKRIVAGVSAEGDHLANGAQLRLRKHGVVVAGIVFDATYYFARNERLSSVLAEKVGETTIGPLNINANDANLADYEKLILFFRTKYGAETSSTKNSNETGFPGLSASSDWSVEGGKVFVSITPLTATTSMLSFGYRLGTK